MRRRREAAGPTPPAALVDFVPDAWPGATPSDRYGAYADARARWEADHPEGELPPPSDAPFDGTDI